MKDSMVYITSPKCVPHSVYQSSKSDGMAVAVQRNILMMKIEEEKEEKKNTKTCQSSQHRFTYF